MVSKLDRAHVENPSNVSIEEIFFGPSLEEISILDLYVMKLTAFPNDDYKGIIEELFENYNAKATESTINLADTLELKEILIGKGQVAR